jgi:hypothetical protein
VRRGALHKRLALVLPILLLFSTALAKLISVGGTALVLATTDEVTGLRVAYVMVGSAAVELLVCVLLLALRSAFWRGFCLVSLGLQFALYHLTRCLMGITGPPVPRDRVAMGAFAQDH